MVEVYSIPCREEGSWQSSVRVMCVCFCVCVSVSGDMDPLGSGLARYHLTHTHAQIDKRDTKMTREAVKVMHCRGHVFLLRMALWDGEKKETEKETGDK